MPTKTIDDKKNQLKGPQPPKGPFIGLFTKKSKGYLAKNDLPVSARVLIHVMFVIAIFITLIPFALLLIVSFTDNAEVIANGFQFFPKKLSLGAYNFIFKNERVVSDAYKVTLFVTIFGTVLHLWIGSMYAYALSKKDLPFRGFFTFLLFFTMLFNGGMVASYIINTQVLHLKNTIWILILPLIMNAWHILIMRTYFNTSIPQSLEDAAKIDGADDFMVYRVIIIPLAKPVLATIALFQALIYWNEWFLSLMYITEETLYSLQFVMLQTMRQMEAMQRLMKIGASPDVIAQLSKLPVETVRFAMVALGIGPIIFAYPFFQRYFVKGMTIGSVKG